MKKPQLAVRPCSHPKFKFVVDLRAYGGGRKFFKFKSEAEAEVARQKNLLEKHSREAVGLSARELSEFITARNRLAEYRRTIADAVAREIEYQERVLRCNTTVDQLAEEVVESKRRDGRSEAYVNDLRKRLRRFCEQFGKRTIASITVEELDSWLRDLPHSPKSRLNFRTNVGVLFSFAFNRRMIPFNPIVHTAKPKLVDKPPEIFAVDELRALLEAAQRTEPDVVPMIAISALGGLRDSEVKRLHWREVDLTRAHIEITAAKAKSARRRIVPIQPNLALWLRPYASLSGPVVPEGYRPKLDRVRKAAGLTSWPNNGLRHSYASYRLAAIHDAPRVASELGHGSVQMLFANYRELVLPSEAQRFWEIMPPEATANVVAFGR
ncbi:MAG TPA: tyrosine-type recombinase/integrase [Candidatus Udaeobacter sp.]|jgi:integrase